MTYLDIILTAVVLLFALMAFIFGKIVESNKVLVAQLEFSNQLTSKLLGLDPDKKRET